jgi:hypothetical protein
MKRNSKAVLIVTAMTSDVVIKIMKAAADIVEQHNIKKENQHFIKQLEITGWQECGEYNGEDPRPFIKIILETKPALPNETQNKIQERGKENPS